MKRAACWVSWIVVLAAAGATAAESKPGTGVHYLVFVRHGDYDRAEGGPGGRGLNDLGREQAQLLAARLAALPIRITSLVTSPYPRAVETAAVLGAALGMTAGVDTLIHECTPRSDRADLMQDRDAAVVAACDSNLVAAWARYVVPTPDADRHDVLVCHGNVIRWFVSRLLSRDSTRWASMDIGNGSLTVVAVRPNGTLKLASFSDVGHLPAEKQTWTGKGAGWSPLDR